MLTELAADRPLPARLRDHALTGDWADHRDGHVKPDLVLIDHLGAHRVGDPLQLALRQTPETIRRLKTLEDRRVR